MGIVGAEAAGTVPDTVLAIEMAAHEDAQAGAGAPARLLVDLPAHALEGQVLSGAPVRSSSGQRMWVRSTRPRGTNAEAGSAGGWAKRAA